MKSRDPNKAIEMFLWRPSMFFWGVTEKKDISLKMLFSEFVVNIFNNPSISTPSLIRLAKDFNHYTFTAYNAQYIVDAAPNSIVPYDFEGYDGFVDWIVFKLLNSDGIYYHHFLGIANLVSITNWMLIDITTTQAYFRQSFYKGKETSICVYDPSSMGETPYLRLAFTPNEQIFGEQYIVNIDEIDRLLMKIQDNMFTTHTYKIEKHIFTEESFEIILMLDS